MKTTRSNFYLAATLAVAIFSGVTTAANSQPADGTPLVEMHDVPIFMAIESLARNAGIKYLIDPKLFPQSYDSKGYGITEPTVTFTWTNMSPKDALLRLLKEHDLILVEDEFTTIARITGTNQVANVVDSSLLDSATSLTNEIIPVVQFRDTPLNIAITDLIKQTRINVALDPKVSGEPSPPDYKLVPVPTLSVRWEKITARQAIVALCENYGLVIVKDSATGVIRIKPKDQ
jgi:hypothetical protein